jgi:hypothetical protein
MTVVMTATEKTAVNVAIGMTDTEEEKIALPTVGIVLARLLLVARPMNVALPDLHPPRGSMKREGLQGTKTGEEALMIVEDLTLILIVVGMMTVAATENVMKRTQIDMRKGHRDMRTEKLDSAGKRLAL